MELDLLQTLWRIAVAAAILGIAAVVGSWLAGLANRLLERTGLDPMVRRLLARSVRPLAVVIGAIAAVQYLDVDLTPVTAMLGASTLAIGMALQGSLSNVASGAMLLTLRPYRVGDFVSLAGHSGTVEEQSYFRVLLRNPDGVLVSLTNNNVFNGSIENYTLLGKRRIAIDITLDPSTDPAKAIRALHAVLVAHEDILDDPAPDVIVSSLTPRGPVVTVRGWVPGSELVSTRSELIQACLAELKKKRLKVAPPPVAAS